MLHVRESEIEGMRAPAPHARTLKHAVAPWAEGSSALWVGFSIIDRTSSSNPHHHGNEEIFIVISGEGSVVVGDEVEPISPGSVVRVPPSTVHQLVNDGDTELKVACVAS